jgi:cysteine-rich repeat protein
MNGDLCCPTGATLSTDSDCPARCGDGVVSTGESCDTAIAAGTGSCPTSCDDAMACTRDVLVGTGCSAVCTHPRITTAANGDGCCPTGATIGNDNDCSARCGDAVVTAPETCDDGNTTPGDGCSATCTVEAVGPTAFRLTDLDLRDPHIFANVVFCTDVTNTAFGQPGFNPILQENIQMDGDMPPDGLLDFSLAQVWRPLVQTAGASTASDLVFPDCTTSTSCALPGSASRLMGTAMNLGAGAICLDAVPGTTRASYTPAIVYPTAPASGTCYVMNVGTLTFDFGGTEITLTDAVISGEWFGNPATEIRDGLIRGFLSEAAANHTIIPDGTAGLAAIDCQPLGSLLPGGNPPPRTASDPAPPPGCADGRGAETPLDPPASCATHNARDIGPGGASGWYFYLNFTATRITTYTE